jgi:hypothetical protein
MSPSQTNNFKTSLAAIKRRRPTFGRGGSGDIVGELLELLNELRDSPVSAEEGVKSVASLYEADHAIFDKHDDSNGSIGYVFKVAAAEAFCYFAAQCADKKSVIKLVFKLNKTDDYGVRDSLFAGMASYLSAAEIQLAVEQLWTLSNDSKSQRNSDEHHYDNWLQAIKTLAKQTSNPELYADACRRPDGEPLGIAASIELARVFYASGNPLEALNSLAHLPIEESFMEDEHDELLTEIYRKLANDEMLVETLWRVFRRERCPAVFESLLQKLGPENKERLVDEEISLIFADADYEGTSATFLIDMGRLLDAERYVIAKFRTINGGFYSSLLPLAESMMSHKLHVGTSLIYRALLVSILHRAKAANYHHGIKYLKKLDKLALKITDWKGVDGHDLYLQQLRKKHRLKSRFWQLYG